MKKLLLIMAIVAITLLYNCSTIEENNDPIIGIWYNENALVSSSKVVDEVSRKEWTFNDVYLGRYHRYNKKEITFKTDFRWSEEDGIYTISYPGTDLPTETVILDGISLKDPQGNILAIRE